MFRPLLHLAIVTLGVVLAFSALTLIGFSKIAGR